ncbi:CheB methylesterase domain-containing protein [Rufibacter latericius]|uniref:protein-glutamate methylesterase n=1 Tax=Rufibacter latericius TaxID=2487040 RepID=A0A3M9MIN7_9BACT|nr:CheB methylesterase domain-containing protein [Rufibacter latericius]RNI25017.1 chemotaxis protein CheB [Rufibacter latericius]
MIDAEPQFEVVDTAQTQEELLHKAFSSQPDLIVTHYGLTMSGRVPLFRRVYGEQSSILLMVSQNLAQNGTSISHTFDRVGGNGNLSGAAKGTTREAIKAGLMSKLRELVHGFSAVNFTQKTEERGKGRWLKYTNTLLTSAPAVEAPLTVVVIGASTGGTAAVEYLVKDLSISQPTVVLVAVHMPEKFTKRWAKRLQKKTPWRVEEGYEGMVLSAGTIVIAPGGQNMRVQRRSLRPNQLTIGLEPSEAMDSPSVDVLMQSAACCAQTEVMGVIMTGMGSDGTQGAREIINKGGVVIAQNKETSTIFGMAKSAIQNGVVNGVFPIGQINSIMDRFVTNRYMSHELQQKLVG